VRKVWFEAADSESCQRALDPIADARALADKVLAHATRPLGVLRFQTRDRRHAAVVSLAAQPTEKGVGAAQADDDETVRRVTSFRHDAIGFVALDDP
jgi:hypothetical protein